jgi:hypothetical protein
VRVGTSNKQPLVSAIKESDLKLICIKWLEIILMVERQEQMRLKVSMWLANKARSWDETGW